MRRNVPKTTRWRWGVEKANTLPPGQAQVKRLRKTRTYKECGQRWIRQTGHSFHQPTNQSFCEATDPQNRTVEQWLTEVRGGVTSKELQRLRMKKIRQYRHKPVNRELLNAWRRQDYSAKKEEEKKKKVKEEKQRKREQKKRKGEKQREKERKKVGIPKTLKIKIFECSAVNIIDGSGRRERMSFTPDFVFLPGTAQLRLQASPEAVQVAQQNSRSQQTTARLPVTEQRAEADAKVRVSALGRNPDKRSTGTEAEGDRRVGFGRYCTMTYREFYETVDAETSSYRHWVRQQTPTKPNSRLAQLKQYVVRRDQEPRRTVTTSAASAATTSSAAATVTSSQSSSTFRSPSATLSQTSSAAPSTSSSSTSSVSTLRKKRVYVLSTSSPAPPAPAPTPQPRPSSSSPRKRRTTALSASSSPPPPHPKPAAPVAGRAPPPAPLKLAAPRPEVLLPAAWRSSLPSADQEWIARALFVKDQTGRPVLSPRLQLWYHPPGPRLVYNQRPSSPDAFFQRPFFLWAPYRMWQYHLKCPTCGHKLTGGGIYKTVRRVLDLDGWYCMGTEYLECRYCGKKLAAWSECVRKQLDFDHQLLFPAVLTYRLSCDKKVLAQLKGRTLGNSVSRLHSLLEEQHTAEWMRRCIHYLNTCRRFEVPGVQMPPPADMPSPADVPKMEAVPSCSWLLSTYARDAFTRIEELRAKVTSTFGTILKMDSSKKMYLLEGLTTWNEDWAQVAAGGAMTGKKCYSVQEQHILNQLSQQFFRLTLVESYTKPLEYTDMTEKKDLRAVKKVEPPKWKADPQSYSPPPMLKFSKPFWPPVHSTEKIGKKELAEPRTGSNLKP
ncbi:hypothetical protein ABVT39_022271 [Epinephelus coioides]